MLGAAPGRRERPLLLGDGGDGGVLQVAVHRAHRRKRLRIARRVLGAEELAVADLDGEGDGRAGALDAAQRAEACGKHVDEPLRAADASARGEVEVRELEHHGAEPGTQPLDRGREHLVADE